jgi:hypothetical protein
MATIILEIPSAASLVRNPKNQDKAANRFCANRQECEHGRNVHDTGEKAHCPGEAESTKPPQHFLSAIGEEDQSEHEAKDSCRTVNRRLSPAATFWHAHQESKNCSCKPRTDAH